MVAALKQTTQGYVIEAYGNLLRVRFDGHVRLGEVAYVNVENVWLKAEVIEIVGQEAKIQVFEDTQGVRRDAVVTFSGHLLEAELGPGLLQGIFDGLQNRLQELAEDSSFLQRGKYVDPLSDQVLWEYSPKAVVGDVLKRGDTLGIVKEGRFDHRIMVPFACFKEVTITWVISAGNYNVNTVVAKARDAQGEEYAFTMVQKWPIKQSLIEGERIAAHEIMDVGLRILDTQIPILKGGDILYSRTFWCRENSVATSPVEICCSRYCGAVCLRRACRGGCRGTARISPSYRPPYEDLVNE